MRKVLIWLGLAVSLLAAYVVMAQSQEGVITYEVKINMHRTLPPDRENLKAMLPEFRTLNEQLFFNGEQSLYKPLIEDQEEPMGTGGMQIRMQLPNNELYIDWPAQKILARQEFMGKDYLIEDTLKVAAWKFGNETKVIQGYTCKQAFYTDESRPERKQEITAWYTDQIRPFLGPDRFNSLPGTVLAVDINNGERVLIARKVELRPLKKNELKIPSRGTLTTRAEFQKVVEEQMKRMGANGGMIIRN